MCDARVAPECSRNAYVGYFSPIVIFSLRFRITNGGRGHGMLAGIPIPSDAWGNGGHWIIQFVSGRTLALDF